MKQDTLSMLKKSLRRLGLSACLISSFSLSAQATTGPAHQLNETEIRLLKALKTPIAVIGYLPAGCRFYELKVTHSRQGVGGGPGYEMEYLCQNSQFTLRASSGGFGGPGGDKEEMIWNPVYGKIPLLLFVPGGQLEIEHAYFYSDWFGKGPLFYSLMSGDESSEQLDLKEARKILQSIRPLP